jgi:hypothetical protein
MKIREGIMRTLKIAIMYFIMVAILITGWGFALSHDKSDSDFYLIEPAIEIPESTPFIASIDCFEYAELVTGFSAEVLRGIAATESRFRVKEVGDNGMSLGMFQLHSRWHEERVKKWGDFDPTDPYESAVIAARIMRENLRAFKGDLRKAVAAYNQGVFGVRRNGVSNEYVDNVLNWRNNSEKVLSFFIFRGITDTEVLQDGYKSSGAQNTYKFSDSSAIQVSWWGSGLIPR